MYCFVSYRPATLQRYFQVLSVGITLPYLDFKKCSTIRAIKSNCKSLLIAEENFVIKEQSAQVFDMFVKADSEKITKRKKNRFFMR